MTTNYHQLSLKDTFSDCNDMFMDDVPSFFQLLEQHFDISLFIPQTFFYAFYQHLGRKRDYPLTIFPKLLFHTIPEMKAVSNVCDCKNPCSTAVKGRTTYTYENLDFRMFPGIQRDSQEWDSLYKIRCLSCQNCKSAYRHRRTQYELSTVHP